MKERLKSEMILKDLQVITDFHQLNIFSPIFGTTTFWGIFLQGFVSGILGILMAIFILFLLKNKELQDVILAFKTKFSKNKVVLPTNPDMS